uniref:Variant surface glycoprotein n=1 Tax=Trypanosoma brucei TaxID=5691 RepID=S5G6M4_9TRYP|nr:variant surface glycoprotein [Trypanosoma brucei]
MTPAQLTLFFLLAGGGLQSTEATALGDNENTPYFNTLCSIIKVATTPLPELEATDDVAEIAALAQLVNLTAVNPEALKQIADKAKAKDKIKEEGTPANTYCKEGKTTVCEKLAELLASSNGANLAAIINQRLSQATPGQHLLELSAAISAKVAEAQRQDPSAQMNLARQALNNALEGKDSGDATAAELTTAGNREDQCGKPQAGSEAAGTTAGESLAKDSLCMCATTSTANSQTACGTDIQANGAAQLTWGTASTQHKQWENLKNHCKQTTGQTKLSPNRLRTAAETYLDALTIGALTTKAIPGTIGYTENSPTVCNGEKGSTNGACVFYGKAQGRALENKILWRQKLLSAAGHIEAAIKTKQTQLHIISQIKALNVTLTALTIAPQAAHNTAATGASASTESRKEKPSDHKQKECEAIKKAKLCKEKKPLCEWKGENDEDGPHCKLNTTAAEQQATQAGTTGEKKEGPASTGCARHGTDKTACENDKTGDKQNCAWRKGKEGETDEPEKEKCRNGSFLLTKKFALSVVSAAFMALLF